MKKILKSTGGRDREAEQGDSGLLISLENLKLLFFKKKSLGVGGRTPSGTDTQEPLILRV